MKIKRLWKKIIDDIYSYLKNNQVFVLYIILSLLPTIILRAMTVGNILNYKPFITDLGLILIFGSFTYFFKESKRFIYLEVLLVINMIICIIDSVYYMFYTSFASISELNSVTQLDSVAGAVYEKISLLNFIYIIFPILFLVLYGKVKKRISFFKNKNERKKKILKTILAGFILLVLSFITAEFQDYSRIEKLWNKPYIVERFGIIFYQGADIIHSIQPAFSSMFGFEKALTKVDEFYNNNQINTDPNQYTGIIEGYNIVFIHLETIQSFLLDLSFNGKEVLPTMHKLINEGMYFSNFYPQISSGTSSDTEFTLLTSLMPSNNGQVFINYYNREYQTIPKILNDKGYYTFSMHGNNITMWNRDKAHVSLGYKNFYFADKYTINEDNKLNLGINDNDFFKQSIPYLEDIEKSNTNYMGTIITLSNHSPYIYLEKYAPYDLSKTYNVYNKNTKTIEKTKIDYLTGTTIGNFIISSHSADLALGTFIEDIINSKYFNNTIFVFYGDHDAKFFRAQYNYLYNYDPLTNKLLNNDDENYYDYNEYVHMLNKSTPLVIWTKNEHLRNIFKGEITSPMGMIDIMPTIGNMMGFSNQYALGNDIFNIKDENIVIFPNGDFLTNNFIYKSFDNSFYTLKNNITVDDKYIEECKLYTEKRLKVSNDIIVHDLIKIREQYKKDKLL